MRYRLCVDGGAAANNFLMQFQSDILGARVERPAVAETTALGAAYLAGLYIGFYRDFEELKNCAAGSKVFRPRMTVAERTEKQRLWEEALARELYRIK